MNMGLMVNEHGEACLVHDAPFLAEPSWAEYDHDMRTLVVVLEDGSSHDVGFKVDDKVAEYMVKGEKILLVQMNGTEIVEGYDLNLIIRN